ncbi:MAG: glycine--tRNA ligase subunit beta [Endomicrobium sp.]|jgi:glycyl-tRNA synthetase beta chain|nr:glycine--tRNA ligase subunit beta [Endomicrobium sp.]
MGTLNTKTALLEIGVEELPTSYINPALQQIKQASTKALTNYGLIFNNIKTYATPRRLVLIIEGLYEKSNDTIEELLGPSIKAAKDLNGNFTKAALGFAVKNDTTPEKLKTKVSDKGEYLCFTKTIKGEPTKKLLGIIFPEVIKSISFPKNMIWEETGFKFARPIRNIVALFGKNLIKFKIADVTSSNWTVGLHTYDNKKIKIDMSENYLPILKNKSVIVDQDERRQEIKNSIKSCVNNIGDILSDEAIIEEVNYLVEYPSAICCSFDKKYLNLPKEVLTVCMRKSQKCFAVNDKNGSFSNHFVGIKNGTSAYQDIVKEGYQKVVLARLADAEFFYNNDLKNGLQNNVEKLKGIVFHKEIGTIYEKTLRIKQIALIFNKEFNLNIDNTLIEKAAMLSKTDLVSEMVFEYPELQGIMGKIYALKLNENSEVAQALQEHYFPLSSSGTLPTTKLASIISMADKIDTLAANFSIGLEPSGSADPYGLRRSAIGFIRIALEVMPKEDLSQIIKSAFDFLPNNIKNNNNTTNPQDRLTNFLWQRIENLLETQGFDSSEIKAVTNEAKIYGIKKLGSLKPKLLSLQKAKQKGDFVSVSGIFKRINNILNQAKKQNINITSTVNQSLLIEESEKTLFEKAIFAKGLIEKYIAGCDYDRVFDIVLELKVNIDSFFDKVTVMTNEENIKSNRIAILQYIKNIFSGFIDFSICFKF